MEGRSDRPPKDPEVQAYEELAARMREHYEGDKGSDEPASVPSLPADGDPLLHSPVTPPEGETLPIEPPEELDPNDSV